MYEILYYSLVAIISATSCSKKEMIAESFEGNWELRKSAGMLIKDYAPNSGNSLKLIGNNYEMVINGVSETGTYTFVDYNKVGESTCLQIKDYSKIIVFDKFSTNKKFFIKKEGSKLYIITGCFTVDAGVLYTYEKI